MLSKSKNSQGGSISVIQLIIIKLIFTNFIADTAMGYKLNAQRNSKNEYVEAVDK